MKTVAPPSRLAAGVTIGVLCLIWGSTWIVIKHGLAAEKLPPFTSAGMRFVIAAIAMALVAGAIQRVEGGHAPPLWLWIVAGFTNFGTSYGIVYWAETRLDSGLCSLLWAVFPLQMAIASHFWLRERLRAKHAAGFLLGFAGIVVLFYTDLAKAGPEAIPTALILLLSPTVCVPGTIIIKKYGSECSSALLNRNAAIVGAVMLCGIGLLTEDTNPLAWSGAAWGTVIYLALVGTCLTFGLYFWLLRHAQATRMSLIAYATPPIALFLGWAFRGEPIYSHTLVGSALVLLGIALVVRR